MRRTKSWLLAVLAMSSVTLTCYGPDTSQAVDDTTSAGSTTSAGTTGVQDTGRPGETGTSAGSDTTSGPIDTGVDTGGCMPGIFGESRFGEACFQ